MYRLADGIQTIVESQHKIEFSEQEVAWFCVEQGWFCDPHRRFSVVEFEPPVPAADGGPDVVG